MEIIAFFSLYCRDNELSEFRRGAARRLETSAAKAHALEERLRLFEQQGVVRESQQDRDLQCRIRTLQEGSAMSAASLEGAHTHFRNDPPLQPPSEEPDQAFQSWQAGLLGMPHDSPGAQSGIMARGRGRPQQHFVEHARNYCYNMMNRGSCSKGSLCKFDHDIPGSFLSPFMGSTPSGAGAGAGSDQFWC